MGITKKAYHDKNIYGIKISRKGHIARGKGVEGRHLFHRHSSSVPREPTMAGRMVATQVQSCAWKYGWYWRMVLRYSTYLWSYFTLQICPFAIRLQYCLFLSKRNAVSFKIYMHNTGHETTSRKVLDNNYPLLL
jgi:hypothetical protein